MNEKLPQEEETEGNEKTIEEARMEIKMLYQQRYSMGNTDRERDDFEAISARLEEGSISPEEAVRQAEKIRHGAQRE